MRFLASRQISELVKGEYVAQQGVVVKMEELNNRNETHEFIVVENNIGIPQTLNHACDPVILQDTDGTVQDVQDVQHLPEQYSKKLSEREFDLNDIYIGKLQTVIDSIMVHIYWSIKSEFEEWSISFSRNGFESQFLWPNIGFCLPCRGIQSAWFAAINYHNFYCTGGCNEYAYDWFHQILYQERVSSKLPTSCRSDAFCTFVENQARTREYKE